MNELSCPKCKVGTVQRSTIYIESERYNAFGCNKCEYGYWELFVDTKTYTVSTEGTADQFAKDISEMSDEEEIKKIEHYKLIENTTADQFILDMLKLGKPIETSLVGVFDNEGRGSRRDVDLPFHRDGDYSKEIAAKHSIDYVGLYCIKGGESKTILEVEGKEIELVLQEGQGVILNNKNIRHARKGPVGDRLLLRVWIEE